MAQTSALLAALKKHLRAAGITYADIARALELSEASIKRLFADQAFTLPRLEKVCELAGIELSDLVNIMQRQQRQVEQLTKEQETEIASDIVLLMIAVSVINGFSYRDLLNHYNFAETDCIQKLAQLDRLKLIDLLPGNRIKLRIAPNFHWLPDGPIQRFFLEYVEKDFFDSRFDGTSEKLLVLNGLVSSQGNKELQDKMDKLSLEFNNQLEKDRPISMDEKHGTTLVIAMRQWRYSLFEDYVRGNVKGNVKGK
jgi:transcriptional regulator with XRE-family HTH domain